MIDFGEERQNGNHAAIQPKQRECQCAPQVSGCCFCFCPAQVSLRTGFIIFVSIHLVLFLVTWAVELTMGNSINMTILAGRRLDDGNFMTASQEEDYHDDESQLRDDYHMGRNLSELRSLRLFRLVKLILIPLYCLGIYAAWYRMNRPLKVYLILRFGIFVLEILIKFAGFGFADGKIGNIIEDLINAVLTLIFVTWELVVGISLYRVLVRGGTGDEKPHDVAATILFLHDTRRSSPTIGHIDNARRISDDLKERDEDAVVVKVPYDANDTIGGEKGPQERVQFSALDPSKYV